MNVDDKLKLSRLQHWKIGGLCALQDAAGIQADLMKHVRKIGSVAHQPASFYKFTVRVSRWNPVASRQGDKLDAAIGEECIGTDEEGVGTRAPDKRGKGCIYFADCRGFED